MPFTFAHPAIVLPLSRYKRLSLTGLVMGSMAPDFEYFINMKIQSRYSHTIVGMFWFDVPMGVLLAFIFHDIVRNTLFSNLWLPLKKRLWVFRKFNWNSYFIKHWPVVLISILIGAGSHLIWDSFTHPTGYSVGRIPLLAHKLHLYSLHFELCNVLQHCSTLIGAIVIIYALRGLPVAEVPKSEHAMKYWQSVILITLIVLILRLSFGLDYKLYADWIVSGLSAVMIGLILTPLIGKQSPQLQ